jgi:phospholipid/cholesterol/gamma-HCH transport system permease protein
VGTHAHCAGRVKVNSLTVKVVGASAACAAASNPNDKIVAALFGIHDFISLQVSQTPCPVKSASGMSWRRLTSLQCLTTLRRDKSDPMAGHRYRSHRISNVRRMLSQRIVQVVRQSAKHPGSNSMVSSSKQLEAKRESTATLAVNPEPSGGLVLTPMGRLDADTVPEIWNQSLAALLPNTPLRVVIEAGGITYCDGSGLAWLVDMQRRVSAVGGTVEIRGLADVHRRLLDRFDPQLFQDLRHARPVSGHVAEDVGRAAVQLAGDMRQLVSFVGEVTAALVHAFLHPSKIRWRDIWLTAEHAGANAVPIVVLICFLIGLIMAFQSAMPMRQFGVELYVADLVAIAMLRELGPLMTAILLAGRSGSAFAAELGTMKVNEELDALTTMGLDPVRFLVTTRVLATLLIMPMLTLLANIAGLVGGAIVLMSLNYSLVAYVNQVLGAVDFNDLLSGLLKSIVFALLVAAIGCLRGLQTGNGASAVGLSATRAVVSGIVLIVLADGLFSVLFYYLQF